MTMYDLRGHGRSGSPPRGYSPRVMADDLRDLMDALAIDRAHIISHSFGGQIALHFAGRAGLDATAVVDVIAKGAAQSWQMDNRAATMLAGKFDYGFAVDWMRKDLGYVLAEARQNGAHLPVTALVDQFYSEVQALGGGRWDTSSLIKRLL